MSRAHQQQDPGFGVYAGWVALAVFIGLLGLCYVHMKQKLGADGDRCRELEIAVRELDERILAMTSDIRRLTGRPSLERRRQEGFIQMMDVSDSRLVRLRVQTEAAALPKEGLP